MFSFLSANKNNLKSQYFHSQGLKVITKLLSRDSNSIVIQTSPLPLAVKTQTGNRKSQHKFTEYFLAFVLFIFGDDEKTIGENPKKVQRKKLSFFFTVSSKMLLYPKCNLMLWQCQATERNETAVYDFYMHQYYHYSINITCIYIATYSL